MSSPPISTVTGLLGDWSTGGTGSLSARLAVAIRNAIGAGLLPPGTRLPAERQLAQALSISRSTLVAALDDLRGAGLIESRQGSGTVVAGHEQAAEAETGRVADVLLGHSSPGVNLAVSTPIDASHLPDVAVHTSDLLAVDPGHGFDFRGLRPLRDAAADWHRRFGLPTDAEQIAITSGAQQAIGLALALLTQPGDELVIREPAFPGIFDLAARHRLKIVPVPGDGSGPDPDEFRRACARPRATVTFLDIGCHNPTGQTTRRARRSLLAEAADEYEMAVIEDNTLADLVFEGDRQPSLASTCRNATVVVAESTSKTCWGGLRTGWLRADHDLILRAARLRAVDDLGPPAPSQLMTLRLFDVMADIIEQRQRTLAEAAALMTGLLAEWLPEWRYTTPEGGLSLWVELPVTDSAPFTQLAARHGVFVAPGFTAVAGDVPDSHVRISFDRPHAQISEGVKRLAGAWDEFSRRPAVIG